MAGAKYIKSFDGLRGIGALFILIYHWPGKIIQISHGWEFMQLFFVMSGYLITVVLVEDKSNYTFKKFALRFYIKRSLRLFPLYFIYLLLGLALYFILPEKNIFKYFASEIKQYAGYLFTYTYNFMSLLNFWSGRSYQAGFLTTHLWTLSLEEQFYLVFPFIVFFLSVKNLRYFLLACIVLAPVFRILFYVWANQVNPNDHFWVAENLVRLPFLQMDSLAFGALLAVYSFDQLKNPVRIFRWFTFIIILIYAANILYTRYVQGLDYYTITFGKRIAENWITHNYLFVYIISLVNAWCMILLLSILRGNKMAWLLENKLLLFVGKRSYAIYLFHLPLMLFFFIIANAIFPLKTNFRKVVMDIPYFLLYLGIVFLFAELSFRYVEKYFIKFKNAYS